MNAVMKSEQLIEAGVVTEVELDFLVPDSGQPRRTFDAGELEALSESIKARGVMQPLLVRSIGQGGLMIVDGERRWRAAALANLKTVPVILTPDTESLEQLRVDQVTVNELRTRLTPLELGHMLKQLRDEMKLSPNEIAAHLKRNGLSALAKQEIENLIGLTDLPATVQKMVVSGQVEAKHVTPVRRFLAMPAVMKGIEKRLAQAIDWGGQVTTEEVNEAISVALNEVGIDLTRTESYHSNPVMFDWKTLKDRDYIVQHDGGAWCMDKKKFAEHQAEAKEAGLGAGGKRLKASKSDDAEPAAGEHVPTKSELKQKTEQRQSSLRGKAEEYFHAYLIRALVPKVDKIEDQLVTFAALKRPGLYDTDWNRRGAPGCHYPDARPEPVEKLGNLKAAQDHKVYALDVLIEKRTPKQRAAILRSIALETLHELPWREVQVLAHHVLGDDIAKIWKLDPAFLDLFRNAELLHLAKAHKVPEPDHGKAWDAMKGAELKAALLEHPQRLAKPQILVDLYRKVEKPDRDSFEY
jgi:ParB/RepB/Spo0J family partition protein